MLKRTFRPLAALALIAAAPAPVTAPIGGTPIVIGQSHALPSRILGDTRRINVWLPPGYTEGTKSYPVLYLLDGGEAEDFHHISGLAQITGAWGQGQELIVIGIAGVARRHDLTPGTSDPDDRKLIPDPGGAATYRRFLIEELQPWVARHFRSDGRNGLIGESLAGLFVLDTLLATPSAFSDYAAISPSLWWDKGALGQRLASAPPVASPDRRLFIAFDADDIGPGGRTAGGLAATRIERALAGRTDVKVMRFPEERHETIYHPAALQALRWLYGAKR